MRQALLLLALAQPLAACQDRPAIAVSNATVAAGPNSAAIYASLVNDGGADRLTGIEIGGRVPVSLHRTRIDDGVMRMRAVDGLDVPARSTLELRSGGAHGMAMGRIAAGTAKVQLTFRFARSAPVAVEASLTGPGGMKGGDAQ